MAYFVHFESEVLVKCYAGTHCSNKRTAELTDERLVAKARANPHFIEVDEPFKQTRKTKKKVAKKKVKKKVSKK